MFFKVDINIHLQLSLTYGYFGMLFSLNYVAVPQETFLNTSIFFFVTYISLMQAFYLIQMYLMNFFLKKSNFSFLLFQKYLLLLLL